MVIPARADEGLGDGSRPLLQLTSHGDDWTEKDATESLLLLARNGGGKTSILETIVKSLMMRGAGLYLPCAKPDAADAYERWARECGCEHRFIRITRHSGHVFDFVSWEARQHGEFQAVVEQIIAILNESQEVFSRGPGGHRDVFFEKAGAKFLRSAIKVCYYATGRINLEDVLRILHTLPLSLRETESKDLFSLQMLARAKTNCPRARQHEMTQAETQFLWEWPGLADRTRSSIAITVSTFLDALVQDVMRDLFVGEGNISPDILDKGAIICLDCPVLDFDVVGRASAVIWKSCVYRFIERRRNPTRLIAVVMDEAHYFLTPERDQKFATTCRSQRGSLMIATQNYSALLSEAGGEAGRSRIDSLLGCLNTRIYGSNDCYVTNEMASNWIGHFMKRIVTYNYAGRVWIAPDAWWRRFFSNGYSVSLQRVPRVQPERFMMLQPGGPQNDFKVEAIITTPRKQFRANPESTYLRVLWDQKIAQRRSEDCVQIHR